jgi:hypothetical protein
LQNKENELSRKAKRIKKVSGDKSEATGHLQRAQVDGSEGRGTTTEGRRSMGKGAQVCICVLM